MDCNTILTVLKTQDPAFTLDHAKAVAGYAQERGLTPFTEFYAMLQRGRLVFKDHYSSVSRWAQQQGGYRKSKRVERRANGDIVCAVSIVTNRDYAAALQAAVMLPGQVVLKEELAAYTHTVEVVLTGQEMGKRSAPTGRTWEWLAEKRATEAVLLEVFGREPSRSREMYTAALTNDWKHDAAALMYGGGAPQAALPAPVIEGDYTDGDFDDGQLTADITRAVSVTTAAPVQPPPPPPDDNWFDAVAIVVCDVKAGGKPHIGLLAAGEKFPSVRWWKGRKELLAAIPGLGLTLEQLEVMNARYPVGVRVWYEMNGDYKNAVRFDALAPAVNAPPVEPPTVPF